MLTSQLRSDLLVQEKKKENSHVTIVENVIIFIFFKLAKKNTKRDSVFSI